MYLEGWLYFLTLEMWPFIGDILCVPATYSPLVIRTICFRGAPYVGHVFPSIVVGCLLWVVLQVWVAPVQLVARPCLVWRLLLTDGWGWVTRWLAVEPQEILGLVLTYWWEELGSGMSSCIAGVLHLVSACWWAWLVPDTTGSGVRGIPELVSA